MPADTLIAVASYNRPFDIVKTTGFWLQQLQIYPWVVCVEPQQKALYAQSLPAKNLITSSKDCWQCGQLLKIKEYAQANGFKYVLKVDDDSWFTDRQFKKKEAAQCLETHLPDMVHALETDPRAGAVAFIRVPSLLFNKKNLRFLNRNRYISSAYLINVDYWEFPHKIWGFEDVWTSVNVTQHFDKDILIYGRMALNAVMESNKGGLQSKNGVEGRDALAANDLTLMQQDYPKLKVWENSKYASIGIDPTMYAVSKTVKADDPLNTF
jgi:hypothetical protein